VSKALQKEDGTIFTFEKALNDPESPHFGLFADLTPICPNYDAMTQGGHLKVTELGVRQSISRGIALEDLSKTQN
ncbi:unnamed protein product, partial [Allacma fusca]